MAPFIKIRIHMQHDPVEAKAYCVSWADGQKGERLSWQTPKNMCSARIESRRPGTTSQPTCRLRRRPCCIRARAADRASRPGAAVPDGGDHAGGLDRPLDRDSRSPFATSTRCGGRRPLFRARTAREGAGYARRTSTTSTRASARRAATSRTRRCPGVLQQAGRRQAPDAPRRARASGVRALAFAGALFGLELEVYMVKVSFEQKPYRRALMETRAQSASPARADGVQGPRDPGR